MHPFIVAISLCSIFLLFLDAIIVSAQPQPQPQFQSQSPPSPFNATQTPSPNTNSHAPGGGHHGPYAGHHRHQRGHHAYGGHHQGRSQNGIPTPTPNQKHVQVTRAGSQNPPSPPTNNNEAASQGDEKKANPGKLFGYIPKNDTSDNKILLMDEFLHAHNWVRSKYNLPPFTWDTKLESFASSYLMKRYNDCKMIHSGADYGENLFWGRKLHWTPSDAVFYWYDEKNWYDLNTLKCMPNKFCGHFTQLVWKDSTRLGCAVQHCNDRSLGMLIACEYDPPGNYKNEDPLIQHNQQ